MGNQDKLIDEILNLKTQLRGMILQHYLDREVFGWVWWLGIACIVIPFIIWLKVVDKKRLLEICVFGLIVNVFAAFLDVFGADMVLWEYPIRILPQSALLFPVDFIVLPVANMIIYQKFPAWGKYLLASALTAAGFSFILEPIAVWIGEYRLVAWSFFYSFPIYILIDILAKFMTEKLNATQNA